MRLYRKGLRVGVAILFAILIAVHYFRGSRSISSSRTNVHPLGNAVATAYKPRTVPIIHPSSFFMPKHRDGYETFLWTDAFLKDERIYLISMVYVDTSRNHANIVFKGKNLPNSPRSPTVVHVRDAYESVVVAWLDVPGIGSLDRLDLDVTYESHAGSVTLLRAPGGWESGFAMCALFLQDKHLPRRAM